MRRVITSLRTSASLDNVVRQIGYLRSASLLALTALALNTANAAEPATRDAKGKPPAVHVEEQSATAAIPECIEKLQLSAKQHDQIKGIVGKYDASIATVWKQFGERYMQTITLESSLLAAIEDNLSDAQRTQVQEQRRKTAHSEHATTATNSKKEQANDQVSKTVEVTKTVDAFGKVQNEGEPYERSRLLMTDVCIARGDLRCAADSLHSFKDEFPNSPLIPNVDMMLPSIERQLGPARQ